MAAPCPAGKTYNNHGIIPNRCRLPYLYLLDNLIADHRADEAEQTLSRLSRLKDSDPVMVRVYLAHIALARFDKPTADRIIGLLQTEWE